MNKEIIAENVVELFERQVQKSPDQTALILNEETISYGELNSRANRFARFLRKKGIGRENMVAVVAEKSMETAVVILGIIKAGAAYVPVDPEYPIDRINYMLSDCRPVAIVKDGSQLTLETDAEIIELADADYAGEEDTNLPQVNQPGDLLYVIYTSGTTGMPKGVMLEHHGIINLKTYFEREYGVNENDVVLQFYNLTFDGSVFEMTMALLNGAALCVVPKEMKNDIELFENYLSKNKVSIMALPPQFYAQIAYEGTRIVVTAASESNKRVVEKALKSGRYINSYGPTEGTVCATHWEAVQGKVPDMIPIGSPIIGTKVFILKKKRLCGIGEPGELCIAGKGLARGYLNRPDLTKEKFTSNPFGPGKIYRTGDLARWLPDGNIEFLGRIDDQVKIRGFRVELGEIESVIRQGAGVKDAAVLVVTDENGEKEINAYVVSDEQVDLMQLKKEMLKKLPDYMIPAGMMQIDRIPLTANGKPDKKAFPKIEKTLLQTDYTAPRTPLEEELVGLFAEILNADRVGITDSFYEIGGDSIKAIRVSSKLREKGYAVKVSDIMTQKTVENIAAFIEAASGTIEEYSQDEVTGEVQLMPIHEEFLSWHLKNPNHFNQSAVLSGLYDAQAVGKALNALYRHHDTLRIVFDGTLRIMPFSEQELLTTYEIDEPDKTKAERRIEEECDKIQTGFDITKNPLIKAGLFKTWFGDYLLITIHHLCVDIVSWSILLEDFDTAYRAIKEGKEVKLPRKTASYPEWTKKLNEYGQSKAVRRTADYWKKVNLNILNGQIPGDRNNETQFSSLDIVIDNSTTKMLQFEAPKAFGCEINDLLLSALTKAAHDTTGQSKLAVVLEGHGREKLLEEIDVSRTVGWFTNTRPVVTDYSHSLRDLVIGTKETVRRIPDKGMGYGFIRREMEEIHHADLLLNYSGEMTDDSVTQLNVKGGSPVSEDNMPGENIQLNGGIVNGVLSFNMRYNSGRYSDEFATRFQNAFVRCLREVTEYCAGISETVKTPSDYGYPKWENSELKKVFALYPQERIDKIYPLTPMQEGMLYHKMLDENATSYVLQSVVELEGTISVSAIRDAITKTVERYEVLRTRFVYQSMKHAVQVVLKEAAYEIEEISLPDGDVEEVRRIAKDEVKRGFDLESDSPMRVKLIEADGKHYMIWMFHHIIVDGWCISLIFNEFLRHCREICRGEDAAVKPSESFSEYVSWLQEQDKEDGMAYYRRLLEGYDNAAEIKSLKKDSTKDDSKITKLTTFDKDIYSEIEKYCRENEVTVNSLVETAVGILLQKYTRTEDAVFGKVVSGRNADVEDIETAVGLFINTIPVRVNCENGAICADVVKSVQKQNIEGTSYHYMPLAEIQSASDVGDGLIKVILAFENYYMGEGENADDSLKLNIISAREEQNYDLGFAAYTSDTLYVKIEYKNCLYTTLEIDTILERIKLIITQLVRNPSAKVGDLEHITEAEKNELLPAFNDTYRAYDRELSIIDAFKIQVAAHPDNVAVNLGDDQLTYSELDRLSNAIAHTLLKLGVQRGGIVGLIGHRSVRSIAGILGIMKAGGAYVPIDPTYPKDRIEFMLADSGADVIVTAEGELPIAFSGKVLRVNELTNADESDPGIKLTPHDLAYVIYTSGTTGKPKGVLLEHKGVINLANFFFHEMDISPDDVMIQFSNLSFDASVWEIFNTLLNGARLCLLTREMIDDTQLLEAYAKENHATIGSFPPQYYIQLGDIPFRAVLTAGSESSEDIVRKATAGGTYFNGYGPTENTVSATLWKVDHFDSTMAITIGRPMQNVQIYILDGKKLCGIGVPGEICMAGIPLARGYLNRPELTAEKFIDNPFGEGKLYRSGDLGRWMPDGKIDFMGRIDDQVKIRGFRIELGEIAETIRRQDGIKDVAVIVSKDSADKKILAYVVSDQTIDTENLKETLRGSLPDYMVPSGMMQIDKIPVTVNGKLNPKALPAIELISESEYVAPANKLQEFVLNVWRTVLDNPSLGVRADFFEAGGNSLNMLSVIAGLKEKKINVKVKDIHNNPTVESLCNNVIEHQKFDRALIETEEVVIEKNDSLISNITENTDNYKWDEYNCFYKPVSIICKSFSPDYFDIVTMNNCFNTLYGFNDYLERVICEGEFDKPYSDLFRETLQDQLKIRLELVNFSTAEEMHDMIKKSIDRHEPVLVAMDSGQLYYSSDYMTRSHSHYMIIKGYDVRKRIYMILDNIQLEKGSSIIFRDFIIPFDVLYESTVAYRNNLTLDGKSWMFIFKYFGSKKDDKYSVSDALRDHIEVIAGMLNGSIPFVYQEEKAINTLKEIAPVLTDPSPATLNRIRGGGNPMIQSAMEHIFSAQESPTKEEVLENVLIIMGMFAGKFASFLNMKVTYFRTVNILMRKCGIEDKIIDEIEQCQNKILELWQPIKQSMFMFASQETIDIGLLDARLAAAKEQEQIYLGKLAKVAHMVSHGKDVEQEQSEAAKHGYYVENPKNAKIEFGKDSVRMELSPNEIYDLWQYDISAPRVGKTVISDEWEVSAKICMDYAAEENRFQDGILLNLENGSKFMFGICNERPNFYSLEIHCPELNEKYKLFYHVVTAYQGGIQIRVRRISDLLCFDYWDHQTSQWVCAKSLIYKSDVESVELETKSWVKTYHAALFKDVKFTW